ncbi:hypothetical protein PICMEDRAFT_70940 [Pichia membranifaciens NRRL Y-2026]|uniref:Uncharacterized protein n=1 Tax=Pichia membranifaciens NRRL Y-2026 TaxID=763406 RepID=A0A1E3NTK4_9ASCO|nr:hypothetical protein PICMEDRAFT_70940 [Pichia membranifaciens NRRL Y-2026]ODQ49394.1 hypothetical protein PICMEDRAFT_70940 [Pichia membranifaciens NRRL Y-2026]
MSNPVIRVVVAGDLGTGKSSLVNFFVRSVSSAEFDPTIEETYTKRISIDGVYYNLEIVDTVDNEFRDNEQRQCLYVQSDAIILTYAIDDEVTFTNLLLRYSNLPINEEDGSRKLTYIDGRIKSFPPIILVGTKRDLESSRQVAYQSGRKFAEQLQLQNFIECSSFANINVDDLFISASKLGLEHQQSDKDLTHIYAADEESRNSDLRQISSTGSTTSRISRDNTHKQLKLPENFSSIQEQESPLPILPEVAKTSARPSRNNTQQRATAARGVESMKPQDGCCAIM